MIKIDFRLSKNLIVSNDDYVVINGNINYRHIDISYDQKIIEAIISNGIAQVGNISVEYPSFKYQMIINMNTLLYDSNINMIKEVEFQLERKLCERVRQYVVSIVFNMKNTETFEKAFENNIKNER